MIERPKFKGLRLKLVKLLKEKGISDPKVLDAINNVPRHVFLESAFSEVAYDDRALPIAAGQTISQPYTVAFQTQSLTAPKNAKILEIGTGSGYQCAILCEMGFQVFSIERHKVLSQSARKILFQMGYGPNLKVSDGTLGWKTFAPYHGIIVTAASPDIPPSLLSQLAVGGKLVIPAGSRDQQSMFVITRTTETEFSKDVHSNFRFVPLIGKDGWEE